MLYQKLETDTLASRTKELEYVLLFCCLATANGPTDQSDTLDRLFAIRYSLFAAGANGQPTG